MNQVKYKRFLVDTNMTRPLCDKRNGHHGIVRDHYEFVRPENVWFPIITVVESLRGAVNSIKDGESDRIVKAKYEAFLIYFRFLSEHKLLEFSQEAAELSGRMPKIIGARDRRIAACALVHGFTLVTANRKDFLALGVSEDMIVDWTITRNPED
jgi:predicted nucleic acid-binding protein